MSRYIDADKVKEYILSTGFYCDTEADRKYSAELIDELFTTADVAEVRHGRWIEKPFEFRCGGITTYSSVTDTVCSVCGESAIEYAESPYCPWCGASMLDEVEE